MIESNHKVFRAGYLLATINGKNFNTSHKILKKMIEEQL